MTLHKLETNIALPTEALAGRSSIAEYSVDNGLLKEIEVYGSEWLIGIYTNQLRTWKQIWKSNRFGEGKNQTANARIRTNEDQLLTEGSIVATQTLSRISEAHTLFNGLNGPMNSDTERTKGLIFSPCSQEIVVGNYRNGKVENKLTHETFNDLHSVSINHDTGSLLVVSSGADMVVEIDPSGRECWRWDASEFATSMDMVSDDVRNRRSQLVGALDYRNLVIPTPAQTTHINTATWLSQDKIGVTLFHQGIALVVDRKTKEVEIALTGLVKPHGFQPTEDGKFVVTSTGQGKIIVLDETYKISEEITGFFDNHPTGEISWIHTSFPIQDKIIAVDQTLAELIILDRKSKKLQRIKHPDDWKVSFVGRV